MSNSDIPSGPVLDGGSRPSPAGRGPARASGPPSAGVAGLQTRSPVQRKPANSQAVGSKGSSPMSPMGARRKSTRRMIGIAAAVLVVLGSAPIAWRMWHNGGAVTPSGAPAVVAAPLPHAVPVSPATPVLPQSHAALAPIAQPPAPTSRVAGLHSGGGLNAVPAGPGATTPLPPLSSRMQDQIAGDGELPAQPDASQIIDPGHQGPVPAPRLPSVAYSNAQDPAKPMPSVVANSRMDIGDLSAASPLGLLGSALPSALPQGMSAVSPLADSTALDESTSRDASTSTGGDAGTQDGVQSSQAPLAPQPVAAQDSTCKIVLPPSPAPTVVSHPAHHPIRHHR